MWERLETYNDEILGGLTRSVETADMECREFTLVPEPVEARREGGMRSQPQPYYE
jgi:hypothetical protein